MVDIFFLIKQKQGEFFTRVNLYACHQKVQNSYPHTFFSRDDEQLFMLSTAGVANDNILYARLHRAYDSQFFILFQQHHFNSLVSHPVDLLLIDLRTEMWERPFCVLDGCSTNKSAKGDEKFFCKHQTKCHSSVWQIRRDELAKWLDDLTCTHIQRLRLWVTWRGKGKRAVWRVIKYIFLLT